MFQCLFRDLLYANLPDRASAIAVVEDDRQVTYGELAQTVDGLAGWLAAHDVKRGDRVGVHLHKSLEEVVAMFAAARLGAVIVNINYQWTIHQLEYVLRDCGIKALIIDQRRAQEMAAVELPATLEHIVVKGKSPAHPLMTAWADLPARAALPPDTGIDSDLAALVYTSGSTGQPKGVMLTHINLLGGARTVARYLHNRPTDRLLSLLPFSFDYGLNQLTTMFLVGGTVVLQKVMMPAEIVRSLVNYRITGFAAVPPAWIPVVRYLADNPIPLPDLRYVTNSGGKIPLNTLELMAKVLPTVLIYLMYGFTEAFRSTYLPPEKFAQKMGSIGRAIPNADTYVVDEGIGVCGPGQQGELVHRGSLVSNGYWGRQDLTDEKIRPCPQLRHIIGDEKVCFSGDLVCIDDDGDYWFVGRRDDMIKSGGFRISPTEVEDVVSKSGRVTDVVAFGVTDELLGEAVELAVTVLDDERADEVSLLSFCRQHLPHYMVPRKIHVWRGDMPRSGNGKLDRPAIIKTCTSKQA